MDPYKQAVPAIDLSLERGTGRVPRDGNYYVILDGQIQGRHRGLRQAQRQYKQLLADSGWKPDSQQSPKENRSPEAVERYMDELEAYWSSSHKHTRRGGSAMYRS